MDNVEFDNEELPQVPRLSIANLMVLTFGVAVCMAIARNFSPPTEGSVRITQPFPAVFLVYGTFIGLSLAGLVILLANAIWRRSFPLSAPGHWLLASQATGVLPLIAYSFLFFALEGPPTGYAAVSTFAAIIQFALHVSACIRFRSEKLWAVLFGVITLLDCSVVIQLVVTMVAFSGNIQPAANSIAGNLLQAISWFYLLRPSISFFVFVTVVAFDFSKWSSRDWLHWLGILLYGAHLIGGLATFVMIAVARFS